MTISSQQKQRDLEAHITAIRTRDRAGLARAITLIESTHPRHRMIADQMIQTLLPETGGALRIGITGVPGVGKSTFIEAFGLFLIQAGYRLAVLAVDPSSNCSGGSILGDKTRMTGLSAQENAFIRPSPSAGRLGGVARTTRETLLLCEAAGYDIVLVETVGVGQNEAVIAEMVDFFLLLMLPGAGDALQGIKRGILELADLIAINKADGNMLAAAEQAAAHYRGALQILRPKTQNGESPPVLTCSALNGSGLAALWDVIQTYHHTGTWQQRRRAQQKRWLWSLLEDRLMEKLRTDPKLYQMMQESEKAVESGQLAAGIAVEKILCAFYK